LLFGARVKVASAGDAAFGEDTFGGEAPVSGRGVVNFFFFVSDSGAHTRPLRVPPPPFPPGDIIFNSSSQPLHQPLMEDERPQKLTTTPSSPPSIATAPPSGKPFRVVVAASVDGAIGRAGRLPWSLPREMRNFAELTKRTSGEAASARNAVIMGRKTFESIPRRFRPLAGRVNIVLSAAGAFDHMPPEPHRVCRSLDEALRAAEGMADVERVFVIGGSAVYREAMAHPACEGLHLTLVARPDFEGCDAFMPAIPPRFDRVDASPPLVGADGVPTDSRHRDAFRPRGDWWPHGLAVEVSEEFVQTEGDTVYAYLYLSASNAVDEIVAAIESD
jgi:dihydrofolate reductase